jgi:hypothetical protein
MFLYEGETDTMDNNEIEIIELDGQRFFRVIDEDGDSGSDWIEIPAGVAIVDVEYIG